MKVKVKVSDVGIGTSIVVLGLRLMYLGESYPKSLSVYPASK